MRLLNERLKTDYSRTQTTALSRDRLKNLRIAVIGAGALGNEVVKALGLLGVGRVVIVDPDIVQAADLTRSVFFRFSGKPGEFKASALCSVARELFPDTKWFSEDCEIADIGFGELQASDLLFSCVDTDLARVEIAWISTQLNIPVADAGLGGSDYWHGRVSFFPDRTSACFSCKLTPRRRRELLANWSAAPRPCWEVSEPTTLPSTPTMAAIIGSLQVDFGLRSFFDFTDQTTGQINASTIELTLSNRSQLEIFSTPPSLSCPFHEKKAYRIASSNSVCADDLLDSHSAETIDLDWPICVSAACMKCSCKWSPRRRIGWFRRHGKCPACGSRRILEREIIQELNKDSRWARLSLADVGLPENHQYLLRPNASYLALTSS